MDNLKNISNAFWDEDFWLPPNISWKDIEPGSHGVNHSDYRHLIVPIPLSFVILFLRFLLERYCFIPLGKSLKIKSVRENPPRENKYLEASYRRKPKLNHAMVLSLSKQLDLEDREIERWWRKRRAQDKPTSLVKFCESCYRCVGYLFNFSLGMFALWDKSYLWNILDCAYDYPHHEVSNEIWWYYMISMAFYLSLAISQFKDNKRKDFWQMFIHHVVTLLLIAFSWVLNIHRVGSLILVVHDCADVPLEAAKSLNYAKVQKWCDIVFGFFTLTWIVTRLMMFPRIIYTCIFQTMQPFFPVYFFFNALLICLLILHFIWTHMIFQVIAKSVKSGGIDGDVRSSSDEYVSDHDCRNTKQ